MSNKRDSSGSRLTIMAVLCIVVGLVIGFGIKKVHIGLMIGLALGLLSGNMLKKRS
jgi:predicted ABC-type sugar transport system permease subunit